MNSQPFVILSAELSTNSEQENMKRTSLLALMLSDLKLTAKPIEGIYKGIKEVSFMVNLPIGEAYADMLETIENLAFKTFKQDSILVQQFNGYANIYNAKREVYKSGRFLEVQSFNQDGGTIVNGKMFILS